MIGRFGFLVLEIWICGVSHERERERERESKGELFKKKLAFVDDNDIGLLYGIDKNLK